jgi:hypothetical protein
MRKNRIAQDMTTQMNSVPSCPLDHLPNLRPADATAELNISEWSAWRLIEDGELPSYLFEGCRRVNRQDLDKYIMRCLQVERNGRNR